MFTLVLPEAKPLPVDSISSQDDPNCIAGPTARVDFLGKAALRGNLEYIRLHPVADLDTKTWIYHALYLANLAFQLEIVDYLLTVYPPSEWEYFKTFHTISGKPKRSVYPDHLMRSITDHDNPELIKIYLRRGLDPSWAPQNLGPLIHSLVRLSVQRPKILKVLLEWGAEPCEWPATRTESATSRAACANNIESLGLLLDRGAIFGSSLFDAVRAGKFEAVQYLIDRGASLNEPHHIRSGDGIYHFEDPLDGSVEFDAGSVLHAAVVLEPLTLDEYRGANFEMAELLIRNGASRMTTNHLGMLPYHYALELEFCWTKEQIEFLNPLNDLNDDTKDEVETDFLDEFEDNGERGDEEEEEDEEGDYTYSKDMCRCMVQYERPPRWIVEGKAGLLINSHVRSS